MSPFEENDLGASTYSGEKEQGFEKFLSKPSPRPYQPFGGPIPQATTQQQPEPVQYEQPARQIIGDSTFDDKLSKYEQMKKYQSQVDRYAGENEKSAKHYESLYDDFWDNEFMPAYRSFDGISDFETHDEYVSSLEKQYQSDLRTSKESDGFFGESDGKKLAKERLPGYLKFNQPNGLKDKYLRLRNERDRRRKTADEAKRLSQSLFEQMTSIPIPARDMMDAELSKRSKTPKAPRSKKATNELLDQFTFEDPIYDTRTGQVTNIEETDPRKNVNLVYDTRTGRAGKDAQTQRDRMAAATRGDIEGFMRRRNETASERNFRNKGFLFSNNGLMDGRPVGLNRQEVDLLDIDEMKKLGIAEYKGKPIEEAFAELGGEERLNAAKILQALHAAYNNRADAQIKWISSGRKEEMKAAMEEANNSFEQASLLAAEFGLTDEIVERAESKGFFSNLGRTMMNAINRGFKMDDMADYAFDFFTNTIELSEIEKFIEAAEQLEKIPTSKALQAFHSKKPDSLFDSIGNLLFDNTSAIPEMFLESMSSFLPAYVKTGLFTIPAGAGAGLAAAGPGGAAAGAGIAARANWGVASLMIEYSAMVLEGMQELNIDWKNPKVFAAAWNNQITRDEIKDKAIKKGLPIALFDSFSGLLGGRVAASLHHVKGGKLLDGKAWARSKKTYPRFTKFQAAKNIGLELGTDTTLGMSGEALGQAWSKEPGEAFDMNAITAEGIIGLGPGLAGGALEVATNRNLDVSDVPFNLSRVTETEVGKTGKIDAAGFSNTFNTFKNPMDAARHIIDQGVYANSEERENAEAVLTDALSRMYAANGKKMQELKIVIADRTPFGDAKIEGSFSTFDSETNLGGEEDNVIFINRKAIGGKPLGTFLHEGGHFARILMDIDNNTLVGLYKNAGEKAQLDTMAQYETKNHGQTYDSLDDATKKRVDAAMKGMSTLQQAEEWFAHQYARVLTGNTADKSVKTPLQQFLKGTLHPMIEGYVGTMDQAGKTQQRIALDAAILDFMGYDARGFKDKGLSFGRYQHERPGMKYRFYDGENRLTQMSDEDALNAMMDEVIAVKRTKGITEAKRLVRAINTIIGNNVLSSDMSTYSRRELRDTFRPLAESQLDKEDAVDTAKVYEGLEGEDAKKARDKLVEDVEVRDDTVAPTPGTITGEETTPTKTETVARGQEDLDTQIIATAEQLNYLQNLASQADTKSLKKVSDLVRKNRKLVLNEEEFNKEIEKTLTKLAKERLKESGNKNPSAADIEGASDSLSAGQIIAEVLNIKTLQKNAILTESKILSELTDIVSSKEPDTQRVTEGYIKFANKVEDTIAALQNRKAELYQRIKSLKSQDSKDSASNSALGARWKMVYRTKEGKYKLWKQSRWVDAPEFVNDNLDERFLKKRLDAPVFASASKNEDFEKAKKSLNKKQKGFIRFWRDNSEKDGKKTKGAKKKAAKKTKKTKKPELSANIKAELKEAEKNLTLVNQMLDGIEPEKGSIDWRNVPHFLYHVKENGKYRRITLGELADNSSLPGDDTPGATIYIPTRKTDKNPDGFRYVKVYDPQYYLYAYTNWRIAPQKEKKSVKTETPQKAETKSTEKIPVLYDARGKPIETQKEPDTEKMMDPIPSQSVRVNIEGQSYNLLIDINGNGGLYQNDIKTKDFTDAMILENFGKAKAALIEDMKQGIPSSNPEVQRFKFKDPEASQAYNYTESNLKLTDKLEWYGNKTVQDYLNILDAVRASAGLPGKIGTERMKFPGLSSGTEQTRKPTVFFQPENGTRHTALALFRLRMRDQKAKTPTRDLVNGNIDRLKLVETTIYESAQGLTLEQLDDRDISGYKLQRVMNLIDRRADFLRAEISRLGKKEEYSESVNRMTKLLNNLIFDPYELGAQQGEETAGLWSKVHSGKPWTTALTEFLFYEDRLNAMNKILGYWEKDIKGEYPKEQFGWLDKVNDDAFLDSLIEINAKMAGKTGKFQKSADARADSAKLMRSLINKVDELKEEAAAKYEAAYEQRLKELEKKTFQYLKLKAKNGRDSFDPDKYEYLGAGEQSEELVTVVPARPGQKPFRRGNVDVGIPVLEMFARGRAKLEGKPFIVNSTSLGFSELADPDRAFALEQRIREELSAQVPDEYGPIDIDSATKGKKISVVRRQGVWRYAKGNRVLPKTAIPRADEAYKAEIQNKIQEFDREDRRGATSGNDVSPVQFVEYVIKQLSVNNQNMEDVMVSFQNFPSSEQKNNLPTGQKELKQLPGAPSGGLIPYVWFDFIKEVYQLVGLNPDSINKEVFKGKNSPWNFDGKAFYRDGVLMEGSMFVDGVPDPKLMAEMTMPVVQAVIDSGRVRLSSGTLLNEAANTKNTESQGQLKQVDMSAYGQLGRDIEEDLNSGFEDVEPYAGGDQGTSGVVRDSDEAEPEVIGKLKDKIDTLDVTDPDPTPEMVEKMTPQQIQERREGIIANREQFENKFDEFNKKLTRIRKPQKGVALSRVISAFKDEPLFWEIYGLPAPSKPLQKWAGSLKEHPNFRRFKELILDPDPDPSGPKPKVEGGKQRQFGFEDALSRRKALSYSLGASYQLSSRPNDSLNHIGLLSQIAARAGATPERKAELKKSFLKRVGDFNIRTELFDQSDPATKLVQNFLESTGLKDQALIDLLDVRGHWHQYYGKGIETVSNARVAFVEPIKDAMRKHGVTNEMLGEYLLARAAPSRNMHLREMYEKEIKSLDENDKNRAKIQKMLDKRGDELSGIKTGLAYERIREMESMDQIKGFIQDESNPLQLFYDMNKESLLLKEKSGLIQSEGGINERKAMVAAMSKANINSVSSARMRDNYNYAPMQGFEGETEKLFDNEQAFETVGKSSNMSGKGWDQPKQMFLSKGAFGRGTHINSEGKRGVIGPDPEMVFAVAQEQYFDAAIRSHKQQVSKSFGTLFEIMRDIAYPTKDSNKRLTKELRELPDDARRLIKEEFDSLFEKEFDPIEISKGYEIKEKAYTYKDENGREVSVDGLSMFRRELNTTFQNDPYTFVYRKNGAPTFIKFKKNVAGAQMAASLKNLKYEALNGVLQRFAKGTRFLAKVFTSLNPAFILPNFVRDLQTAAIHLSEEKTKDLVKGTVLNPKRLTGFMKAIIAHEEQFRKGKAQRLDVPQTIDAAQELLRSKDYAKMYQFAKEAGAKVGYFRHDPVPELIRELRENDGKTKASLKKMLGYLPGVIESFNTGIENSIRMSAFWTAIENGRTPHQAANISRNVTVDFNQKGNLTQVFGSMFVFFGASMNSMDRMYKTLFKSGNSGQRKKLVGGIILASFMTALFNRIFNDDDEDDMPAYDTITPYKRDTNIILPMPDAFDADKTGRGTGYFSIPVPLGYNIFWALGQSAADVFAKYYMGRGGSGVVDAMARSVESNANAFNPIGGSALSTSYIPTVFKPLAELYANKNFMDQSIRNPDVDYETPKPAYQNDPKRTQKFWTDLSKWINTVMGGNASVKGTLKGAFGGDPLQYTGGGDYQFNISGSEMEHIALGYTGGPGQIINWLFGSGAYPAFLDSESQPNISINQTPVINRFIRNTTYGTQSKRDYYNTREAVLTAKSELENASEVEATAEVKKLRAKYLKLLPAIKYMDGARSKIRRSKENIESSKNLTDEQKLQRVEELEKKELDMIIEVNKKAQKLGIR